MSPAPQLITLLSACSQHRRDLALASFDDDSIRWAVETGLGALLFYVTANGPDAATSRLWSFLRSADLTARFCSAEQIDAVSEIIDACKDKTPPLTLLKGISISEQHYPEPYLRPMRDIDIMVENREVPVVENVLSRLGYRQHSKGPSAFYDRHHHTMPFLHPEEKIWVEVHRGLFPPTTRLGGCEMFSPANLGAEAQVSEFRGRAVKRFSNELQIVYTACHWAQDLKTTGGMVAMLDLIYLLNGAKGSLDWSKLCFWADRSPALMPVCLLLGYLYRYRLIEIPYEIYQKLLFNQAFFRNLNLKMLQWVTDRYIVGGRLYGAFLSLRNISILWETLIGSRSPVSGIASLPVRLSLPFSLRQKFF